MLTAYKFRMYPNEEQKELFSRYFGCSRVMWNKGHKNDKQREGLNCYDTSRFLRELKQKGECEWLKEAVQIVRW